MHYDPREYLSFDEKLFQFFITITDDCIVENARTLTKHSNMSALESFKSLELEAKHITTFIKQKSQTSKNYPINMK